MNKSFDLVVIGAGPGGYVAAARAAALGLKTAVVEKDTKLGGTCLLRGCIPTKTLLHAADVYSEVKDAHEIGITAADVQVDWTKIQKYKAKIVAANAGGVQHLMKSRNVEVVNGFASIKGPNTVSVAQADGTVIELSAQKLLLAVGSTPRPLPFAPFGERVLSSDGILELDHIPKTLTIIGGGVIGIEFASLFARFGTKVIVLEMLPKILDTADVEVAKELTLQLEKQSVQIYTGVSVSDIKVKGKVATCTYVDAKKQAVSVASDYVLVAVGRAPLTQKIGLESTKATTERGFIAVNQFMQSTEPSIYAIGDCVNTPWLAHVASAEGVLAVNHLAGKNPAPLNYDHIPSCVYSDPPVAWCGLTAAEAEKRGYKVKIGRFDFLRNGKAGILGKKRGFVKFVTDVQYGEILGVHIIGPEATDLLAEPAFAMQMEATIDDIANAMHAHPTLYEAIWEAALVATDRAIHG